MGYTEADKPELRALILEEAEAAAARDNDSIPACTGKHGFDSYNAAQKGIRGHLSGAVHAYQCRHCQKWHVGQLARGAKRFPNNRFMRIKRRA